MKSFLSLFLMALMLLGGAVYGQPEEKNAPAKESAPQISYPIPTLLKGRTYMISKDKLVPCNGKQTAKYTIFYYAAGWCSTCRMNVLHNVDLYKKLIKGNPNVELVMFNMDRSAELAENWAKDNNMPWPILLQKDFPPDFQHLMPLGIPSMVLVDKDGRLIMRSANLTQLLKAAK